MNKPEWQSRDLIKDKIWDIEFKSKACSDPIAKAIELTASAMLQAVVKWMDEPCAYPPPSMLHCCGKQRHYCPQCMAELKGEK